MGTNVVNRLFRGDFFGESAVDDGATRAATVTAAGPGDLRCLALDRENLVKLLGPLRSVMREEKAPQNVQRRMAALKGETTSRAQRRLRFEPVSSPARSPAPPPPS
jgi:CRP-like cAMP-binding protein